MSMAERREEAADLMERACVLCGQAVADLVLWGHKVEQENLCAHLFCLIFASKLRYWQDEESGQRRFIPEDIPRILERVVDKRCFVCAESGAAITCCQEGCDRSYHLPCATEGECVTQYFLPHRCFCREHGPEQEVEAAPGKGTTCIICLEPVGDRKSFHTMVCPICREAWFHRGCAQAQYAGTIAFRCPVCRDKYNFLHGMLTVGIRVPGRSPSWDNGPLGEGLMERRSRCDTRQCLCPGGREQEMLLCSSCAAAGTHRRCANLSTSRSTWECGLCAGQGTGHKCSRSRRPALTGVGPAEVEQDKLITA
ncbi:E3 ubiquitin-protein ligase PHF7-like [Athene noctua]|uniref:E3 ubiquitin-protein ligase PHF7-like n=1 Tax=Athene noctua TaxID=126797 RepID=UPI003EC0893E